MSTSLFHHMWSQYIPGLHFIPGPAGCGKTTALRNYGMYCLGRGDTVRYACWETAVRPCSMSAETRRTTGGWTLLSEACTPRSRLRTSR